MARRVGAGVGVLTVTGVGVARASGVAVESADPCSGCGLADVGDDGPSKLGRATAKSRTPTTPPTALSAHPRVDHSRTRKKARRCPAATGPCPPGLVCSGLA